MPLNADALPRVRFKLEVALHAALSVGQALIVIKDPELGLAVISTSCQQSIFERRPLYVKDVASVSLEQWNVRVECERAFGVEDSHC